MLPTGENSHLPLLRIISLSHQFTSLQIKPLHDYAAPQIILALALAIYFNNIYGRTRFIGRWYLSDCNNGGTLNLMITD